MITGRRVFIQSILALCITAAALVFVFPLRTMLRSPLETRISGIKAEFEETFSGYITYDSISPDMVNRIEIINPSLAMHPSGISAERVTVTYPFWIILSGSRDLPLVTIDIEGFTGYFDLDEDFPEIILPFMFFIDRIDVNFDSIDMAFDYGGSRMENSFEKTALSLYLQKHEFTGEFNSSYHTISGEYNGYARTSLHSGISYHEDRISLQLPSLSADVEGYGSFENFPLLMVLDEQMLFASLHSKNVAALLNYSLKDRELHLSASSEGFSLDETLSIYYESDVVDIIRDIHDLRFNVSVKGILGDGFTFSDISYEGDFRLPEFNYSDISLAYLQGSMSGSLEEMNIQNFQGRINDIPFRYRGTVDIARMTPDGRLDIRMPEHITSETFSVLLEGIGERRVSMDYIHDSFQLRSEIDYHDQANISFDTLVMISDRTYSIPFEYDTKNNFISSLPDADVSFTLDMHQGHAKIFLQWDRFLIPTENTFSSSIPTSGKVIGSIRSLEDFRFTVQSLVIHSIPLGEHRFDLSMKGHITPDFANISSITYQDAYDSINGAGSVVFNRGLGSINRGSVEFSKDNELYQVNFNNYDGFYYSVVNITGGRLNRFPFVTGTGEFDGTVSIFGVPGNLSAELDLFIPNLVYRGNHYEGSISAELDPQGLSIIDSRFSFENIFLENISGRYDFLDGSLDMFLDLHFDAGDMFITTAVSGMASLPAVNGYRQLIDFEGLFEQARVDIQLSDVAFDEVIVSESLNFVMEIAKQQIFLRGGEEEEIFSLMIDNLNREFSLSLYEGLPLQLKAEGFWEGEGRFTFHAEDMVFDLTFLNALQVPRLEFISGVAKGYLIVTGSIQDPDFYGELNIDEAVLDLGFIPTPLRAHNVALTLHGKEMNFSQFNIIVDRVPVKTKLDFYIEKWIPQYFDMQFSIPRNQPIPSAFTFRGAQVAYDGMITGDLTLEVDNVGVHIAGDLLLDDAVVSMVMAEPRPNGNPLLITGDLRITTGKSVQFILPTMELPILTANIEANQSVGIVFHTLRRTFSLTGTLGIKSGEIYYIRRNFYITEGSILLSESEDQIDPLISVRAKIREYDQNANRVDIYLVADNQRLSGLTPRFESNPSLPINEIAQILGESILITDQGSGRASLSPTLAFVSLATDIINQFGLIDQLSFMNDFDARIRNALGLDVFSIRTQLIHNVMLANLTDYHVNPIASYLDNTTIFLGKYLGDSMFFQTMLVLSESSPGDPGLFVVQELKMDLELSFEWQTPLYELIISTQPKLSFPGIFSDFSVGLSWRYSF